jgi:hypothetical protein
MSTEDLPGLERLLDELFVGEERLSREEIRRRATVEDLPAVTLTGLDALPEGEYSRDEVSESVRLLARG